MFIHYYEIHVCLVSPYRMDVKHFTNFISIHKMKLTNHVQQISSRFWFGFFQDLEVVSPNIFNPFESHLSILSSVSYHLRMQAIDKTICEKIVGR